MARIARVFCLVLLFLFVLFVFDMVPGMVKAAGSCTSTDEECWEEAYDTDGGDVMNAAGSCYVDSDVCQVCESPPCTCIEKADLEYKDTCTSGTQLTEYYPGGSDNKYCMSTAYTCTDYGRYCLSGACVPQKANGQTCNSNYECTSDMLRWDGSLLRR
jgi:hypothetical protein